MNMDFHNSGLGLYKGAFNTGLYLFILQENYLPYLLFSAFPELPQRFLLVSGSISNIFRLKWINRNWLAGIC
ncbi:hypothetical protein EO98_07390 [Methanosarcina sp. 2.H.T.1A.6]|nr:hypothetical protein EO94_00390 [Methanosarcina sp. 2.H.T.1A.3]KKG21541.1 hypothetical protein EO98_07390 [Methanosarcina sp. 2.H.T.1A.6]KKG21600.1 hypothetical protein EO96_11875 [Methanosarcina sp. 2.H.T.1A.8]KKG26196.1 hypothetical protein EO97_00965 [Methanosarcina sp. 2.H.T.1A.15]